MYAQASALFEKWGFPGFPVKRMVGQLSVEEKKVVELVRALSIDPEPVSYTRLDVYKRQE